MTTNNLLGYHEFYTNNLLVGLQVMLEEREVYLAGAELGVESLAFIMRGAPMS